MQSLLFFLPFSQVREFTHDLIEHMQEKMLLSEGGNTSHYFTHRVTKVHVRDGSLTQRQLILSGEDFNENNENCCSLPTKNFRAQKSERKPEAETKKGQGGARTKNVFVKNFLRLGAARVKKKKENASRLTSDGAWPLLPLFCDNCCGRRRDPCFDISSLFLSSFSVPGIYWKTLGWAPD